MNKDDKNKRNNDEIVYEDDTKAKKTAKQADSDIVLDEENDSLEALVKKLKEKAKILEKEKQEYMNGWQRERADFVNFKKRMESEKVETVKYANENLIAELLTVIESFDMAFSNKEAWEKVDKNWRVGVEYIHVQFMKVLKENGLVELDPIGEKFDPMNHVADELKATSNEKEDGIILKVNKKGFSLNGRVIVAPKVVVGEFKK
ncbi:MAG: nucleotide exchange factor GrpE [Candidatus Paceibacterota bacterium]|jgi:molecular chaperone GrpE